MPLYDYCCTNCGPFREWQEMSRSAERAACPGCRRKSKRAVTAPFLADMHPHRRIAHQRNEKSAHEPQFVQRSSGERDHGHSHSHGAGHRHDHGGHRHSHGPSRPWMIGH